MVSLITRVDTGHRDMIHDAQMDYYGCKLATASTDRHVMVYDVKPNGQHLKIATLEGHEGPVWQVSWSHPMYGSLLATCSFDCRVFIWKEMSNSRFDILYRHEQHDASVNSINWAPPEFGLILAAASSDSTITILSYSSESNSWESKKIDSAHKLGCNAISWCPSAAPGSLIDPSKPGTVSRKRFVSGGCDKLVKIFKCDDNNEWVLETELEGHTDWVRDVAWAPCVGLNDSVIASCSQDQSVIIWRCSNLDSVDWKTPKILHKFNDVVWHVSWSLCGSILAVSGGDNKVSLWKEGLDEKWLDISDNSKSSDVARG